MTCETCSAIFSRNKCLHAKCPAHQAELAAFQRKIDEHIQAMVVVQAWHEVHRGSTPHETENNNMVSRTFPQNHYHHSAETSGIHHVPGKNEAVGDITPPRNQTFSAPAAASNERIAPDLLPGATSFFQVPVDTMVDRRFLKGEAIDVDDKNLQLSLDNMRMQENKTAGLDGVIYPQPYLI